MSPGCHWQLACQCRMGGPCLQTWGTRIQTYFDFPTFEMVARPPTSSSSPLKRWATRTDPAGVKGCSHGWSVPAQPDAKPVEVDISCVARPGGAMDSPPPPRRGGRNTSSQFHGFRLPSANSTRGYNRRPLRGRSSATTATRVRSLIGLRSRFGRAPGKLYKWARPARTRCARADA